MKKGSRGEKGEDRLWKENRGSKGEMVKEKKRERKED